jgi:hypothetical protein
MRKHIRECLAVCADAGLTVEGVEYRGKHLGFITDHGLLIAAATPSDHRWQLKMRSVARRLARAA